MTTGMLYRSGVCSAIVMLACSALVGQPRDTGYLKAKVNPGRAGIFVDGKYIGPAANFGMTRKYAVPAGKHEIRFEEPRYESISTQVEIAPGKTTAVSQQMKPLPVPKGPFGMVRTKGYDKFAAVYLNDKYYGHVDEFSNPFQGILLPAGEYTLRIEPVGGSAISKKVQVTAGKTVVVEK